MNAKAEEQTSSFDGLKWLVVVIALAAGVVGNWYYAELPLLYRVLGLLGVTVVAALIAFQTAQGATFLTLVKESRVEIRKVVWPTHQETTQTTLIVVAAVIIMGLLLWGLNTLLGWIVSLIIG